MIKKTPAKGFLRRGYVLSIKGLLFAADSFCPCDSGESWTGAITTAFIVSPLATANGPCRRRC